MELNKISVTVTGANRVELVQSLRAFADNLDGMPAAPTGRVTKPAGKAAPTKKAAAPPEEDDGFVSDDGGEPSGFDDDDAAEETETVEAGSADEDFTEAPPKKAGVKGAGKKKKITLDDVNDACKAHAQAKGRPATLEVLQKKFKTQSVTALKPEQYEACIAAMAVN